MSSAGQNTKSGQKIRVLVDFRERNLRGLISDVCSELEDACNGGNRSNGNNGDNESNRSNGDNKSGGNNGSKGNSKNNGVEIVQLPLGDFLFVLEEKAVVIERKTIPDLISSIRSNRLWDQLLRLMKADRILDFEIKRRILLIHGNFNGYQDGFREFARNHNSDNNFYSISNSNSNRDSYSRINPNLNFNSDPNIKQYTLNNSPPANNSHNATNSHSPQVTNSHLHHLTNSHSHHLTNSHTVANPGSVKFWSQLMGAFMEILYVYDTPIIFAEDNCALRAFFRTLAKRELQGKNDKHPQARWYRKRATMDLPVKDRKRYVLASFPMIGETIAKNLMDHFESISEIGNATVEDLMNVPKIGKKKAELIWGVFH